jgi:O-antigen ligase
MQRVWLAEYAVVVLLLCRRRTLILQVFVRNKALFAVVGLALASFAWSDSPSVTLRRSVALALTTVLGVYLATAFSRSELAALVSWTLLGLVVLSAAFALLHPALGIDALHGSVWRGIFTMKNELGRVAALGAVVWFLRALTRDRTLVAIVSAAVCVYVLVQTGSKTALVVVVFTAGFCLILPALRAHVSIAVPATAMTAIGALLASQWLMNNAGAVATSLGRDATLTGRSGIWSAVWPLAEERPWFGYGYSGFWRGVDGPSGQVWAIVEVPTPHAHNGLLDLFLQLGALGVFAFLLAFAALLWRALRAARREWSFHGVLPLVFVLFFGFYNVAESSIADRNSLLWTLVVAFAVQLSGVPALRASRAPLRLAVPAEVAR